MAGMTIYYTVPNTPGPDVLCEKTYVVMVYTDTLGVDNLVMAFYAQGIFGLYNDYISATAPTPIGGLPAIVQTWLTLYAYDPTNFLVYV